MFSAADDEGGLSSTAEQIVSTFGQAGVGWLFTNENRTQQVQRIVREFERVESLLSRRQIPARHLLKRCIENPAEMAAFIQAFASPMTAEVRAAVYLIVTGATIEQLRLDYQRASAAQLQLVLKTPEGRRLSFQSKELWDFEICHHFILAKADDKPMIDGYYAFKFPDAKKDDA
jgi:hypothetical protein